MAGRYPDYDWRGIAMLTQQLGQLFEPSKARLMSQQQDHEMNMLMAKQAWDMQSEQLDALKLEYKGLTADLETQTNAVNELGLRDLANAGRSDGANVDQSAEIYDKLDVKNLSDMQEVAAKYREMIRDTQGGLDNMKLYNEEAKIGQAWRKGSMTKKDRKGVMVDYYEDSDKDGIAELSYEEGQNAIKKFITDNYTVAEGEQGMEMNFGSGDDVETIMVRPEAIAFRAGWESGTGTGTGRGKAETAEITQKSKSPGMKTQQAMDEWYALDATYMNLGQAERDAVYQALGTPGVPVPPELRDTVEQMKRMNKISVELAGSEHGEYAQPLPGDVFESERDPNFLLPESMEGRIEKPWSEITVGDKKQPGLTKELYDSLRKLGSKGMAPRRALEHVVRNWETIGEEKGNIYILQIISDHSRIKAELSK